MAEKSDEQISYTKYEKARIIGARALQIAGGAPFLVKLTEADLERVGYDPRRIAEIEFEKGLIPLTVKRTLQKK
ncbi:DNA-directed RNA polymerase subunit K [Candidatus Woesearchaeota archaeon]|nr:DNA-directed RNA polymerase subunit K [Candidatus Woesearchaeota archaeon]